MYITSRPDKVASETQWLQLEQEVRLADTAHLPPLPKEPRVSFPPVGKRELSSFWLVCQTTGKIRGSSHRCTLGYSGAQQSCLIMLPGFWSLILEEISCW